MSVGRSVVFPCIDEMIGVHGIFKVFFNRLWQQRASPVAKRHDCIRDLDSTSIVLVVQRTGRFNLIDGIQSSDFIGLVRSDRCFGQITWSALSEPHDLSTMNGQRCCLAKDGLGLAFSYQLDQLVPKRILTLCGSHRHGPHSFFPTQLHHLSTSGLSPSTAPPSTST